MFLVLLFLNLFDDAMANIPIQSKGFYLNENQGWEFGFISMWRSNGHSNKLMAVPHSIIRYWDLRYFFDPRSYKSSSALTLPLPDFICVNGSAAKKMYLDNNYPEVSLIEVEALRYLHLKRTITKKISKAKQINQVLVLGDYDKNNTDFQMKLLSDASNLLNHSVKFIVKPHPSCPIKKSDYPEINLKIVDNPISELIDDCAVVYTSCLTSAALDAYYFGKNVLSARDPIGLNLSPLRGAKSAVFVSTGQELADLLSNINKLNEPKSQVNDFFYLDHKLLKWKKLFNI